MSYLYVMERSDLPGVVKIGRSENPGRRARDLAEAQIFTMRVAHVIPDQKIEHASKLEALVHNELSYAREPGNSREWFRMSTDAAACAIWRVYARLVETRSVTEQVETPFEVPSDLPPPSATRSGTRRPWKPGRGELLGRLLSDRPIASPAEYKEAVAILASLKANIRGHQQRHGNAPLQLTANYLQVQKAMANFVAAIEELRESVARRARCQAYRACERRCKGIVPSDDARV